MRGGKQSPNQTSTLIIENNEISQKIPRDYYEELQAVFV
jgi:hypothetical protein